MCVCCIIYLQPLQTESLKLNGKPMYALHDDMYTIYSIWKFVITQKTLSIDSVATVAIVLSVQKFRTNKKLCEQKNARWAPRKTEIEKSNTFEVEREPSKRTSVVCLIFAAAILLCYCCLYTIVCVCTSTVNAAHTAIVELFCFLFDFFVFAAAVYLTMC